MMTMLHFSTNSSLTKVVPSLKNMHCCMYIAKNFVAGKLEALYALATIVRKRPKIFVATQRL